MDGFTGVQPIAVEEPPDAVFMVDRFHVPGHTEDAIKKRRQRLRLTTVVHRGRRGDPF